MFWWNVHQPNESVYCKMCWLFLLLTTLHVCNTCRWLQSLLDVVDFHGYIFPPTPVQGWAWQKRSNISSMWPGKIPRTQTKVSDIFIWVRMTSRKWAQWTLCMQNLSMTAVNHATRFLQSLVCFMVFRFIITNRRITAYKRNDIQLTV